MFGLKQKVREIEKIRKGMENLCFEKRKLENELEHLKLKKRLEIEVLKKCLEGEVAEWLN